MLENKENADKSILNDQINLIELIQKKIHSLKLIITKEKKYFSPIILKIFSFFQQFLEKIEYPQELERKIEEPDDLKENYFRNNVICQEKRKRSGYNQTEELKYPVDVLQYRAKLRPEIKINKFYANYFIDEDFANKKIKKF
jgi:hypothetical protein